VNTGRDIIAEFLEPFGDQPYRMADVLIGRLYKAKLEFGPSDDEFTRVVMENERLRAVIRKLTDAAGIEVTEHGIGYAAGEYHDTNTLPADELAVYRDALTREAL